MKRGSHAHWLIGAWLAVDNDPQARRDLARQLADPELDWQGLMAFANEQLLVPLLHDALADKGLLDSVPGEVESYLGFLAMRNRERNSRLESQVLEACGALTRAGITGMLIKGAAELMEIQPDGGPARAVVGDLDILVRPSEADAANKALAGLGYSELHRYPAEAHAICDLYRPQDAAVIDLHRFALAIPALLPSETMWADASQQRRGEVRFALPSATDHLLCRVLHDRVQDGGLGTAEIKLRNVYQVARCLQRHGAGIDFVKIEGLVRPHGLETALTAMLMAAEDLFGAPMSEATAHTLANRLVHGRGLLRLRYPILARLNNAMGNMWSPFARYRYGPLQPGTAGRWRLMKLRLRHGVPALAQYGGMLARRLLGA
ncbi:MAG: nucleotidyltransferase family protein [Alphaproteobacteria bacterium]